MFDLKREEEVKEFLENLGIEYRFACLKEKKPDGCQLLGDFFESVERNFVSAGKVYKDNCDEHRFGKSCFKYGSYLMTGKGVEQNGGKALEYYSKGCDVGSPEACFSAGLMLTSSDEQLGVATDVQKGLSLLKKSCELGSHHGCYYTSGIYLSGKDPVAKDANEAFRYSEKACDLGNMYACSNLSLMYKTGQGVEKDVVKSNHYKQIVMDFSEQFKKQRTLQMEQGVKE